MRNIERERAAAQQAKERTLFRCCELDKPKVGRPHRWGAQSDEARKAGGA